MRKLRALGLNPRALGTDARPIGVNPRALGVNPQAIERYSPARLSELREALRQTVSQTLALAPS